MTPARRAAGFGLLAALLRAQHGDVPGEVQQELPPGLTIPPALVRSPGEELTTFRVQPGFRMELIASEPLIGDPVAAVQAPDGRLWVVEMRSYMRDVDANGERTPDGRIVVLTDRDGDGRMDDAQVFADGLLLPRAVLPLPGGALVIAPPQLLWLEDQDGDGRADHSTVIIGGFEAGLLNPEHAGNGLLWALDNRIHLADDKRMLRWTKQGFEVEDGAGGGQWGIAQDDRGRLFFDYNEDWLRCDLVPGRCRAAAPWLPSFAGCNHRVVTDTSVWPIRVTTGVNRGYQPGVLKDGVLVRHTAVCAPHVARGDRLGDAYGDVFVCEPAANLVRRFRLAQPDGLLAGTNVYDRAEFLASTDERFRPVNLFATADGALGLVDMYRGVIQHRNYVTTFLRRQIVGRGLERPTGLGRIWRLVAAAAPADAMHPARPLQSAGTAELVSALGERDGWRRDTAQRLLVLRQDGAAVPLLRRLVREAAFAPSRCGAAAALEGLGALDSNDLRVLLRHDDAAVVAFALQRCGGLLAAGDRALWARLDLLLDHPAPTVRWHAALALAEVRGVHEARAVAAWARLGAAADPADAVLRDALCAAAVRREAACVRALAAGGATERAAPLLTAVARAAGCDRDAPDEARLDLLDVAAACMQSWQQRALLQGLLDALPQDNARRQGFYAFAVTPPSLAAMARTGDQEVAARVRQLLAVIALRPAAASAPARPEDRPPEARALVAAGGRVFASVCAACHQLDGRGMAGLAPPLRDSEWVTGEPSRLIRIALHGLRGPVRAGGQAFDGEMPGQSWLGDQDLAAALSFLRRAFGHRESAIDAAAVAAVRAHHAARAEPWTAAALAPGR